MNNSRTLPLLIFAMSLFACQLGDVEPTQSAAATAANEPAEVVAVVTRSVEASRLE